MKGLILVAGHGTRLRPLTYTGTKQLIPIANKPMVEYAVEDLRNSGIKEIGLIVGHSADRIQSVKDVLGDGSRFGVKFTYIEQDAPRGIAHAVSLAEDFMGDEPFVVYLGDNILKGGIADYVRNFEKNKADACILFTPYKNPEKFGVAILDNGKVVGLEEKPKIPKSNLVIIGVYFFRKSVFNIIRKLKPSWRNELEITEAVHNMITSGNHGVETEIVKGWWKDTGKPEDILEANHMVLDDLIPSVKGIVEDGARIIGRVSIDEGTIVKNGSVIKGPTIIGKNCVIEGYVGPHTSISDNSKISKAEVESSIIMEGTTIECKARIIDSLIGKNVVITESFQTPNGSRFIIGENSVVHI